VCADPNNLPFTNQAEEGFENRLAELIAAEMKRTVRYTWWPQRRGFIRNTVQAGACDVVMGVPATFEMLKTTRAYYRSTYVFLTAKARNLAIDSLDDPVLRTLRIGVHMIGDDFANPPPAHALARRGIVDNVAGYSIFGDYTRPNPPARLIEAVAQGDVDVALVWGPFAGYFARRQPVPLEIVPVRPETDAPSLPFVFDIAVGVAREQDQLRAEVDAVLARRTADIDALLEEYGVPRVKQPSPTGYNRPR
jgi:mxaJ protein